MREIWKDIRGFEGLYQISNFGNVKSVARVISRSTTDLPVQERILKPCVRHGYKHIVLSKNGKFTTGHIHRLVAEAFIPNPNNLPCVNHKDENPSNNCVDNLEWCTRAYNNSYNHLRERAAIAKRKPILQFDLNGNFIREWAHAREAAETLGLNKRAIYGACTGRLKTSGGFVWKRK